MKKLATIFSLAFLFSLSNAQTYLGDYTGHSIEGKAIRVHAGSSSVRFIFYKPDILRVDFFPARLRRVLDSSFVIVQDTSENVSVSVTTTDSTLRVASSAVTVVARKNPLRFSYYNSLGQLVLTEPLEGGLATQQAGRWAVFAMASDEHFYGTGERGTSLDKRGQTFDSYNEQIGGYAFPLPTMNLNVPFVASTKGYALYFENTYLGRFDFGVSSMEKFSYRTSRGELSYYLIVASRIQDQLEKYTWLTGRQPLPPKWAFGFIQSKYGYRNETEARAMVQTMRVKQIPCDAIVLDLYWFQHMGDLSWNASAFPNPFQMMTDFLAQGFKTVVITEPYIVSYSGNYSAGSALGYLAKNQSGQTYGLSNWWSCNCTAGLLDITKPEARQWWWSKHPSFFGNELAGIWTDLGEPERHPDDMVHYLGSTAKVHNIYNLLWAKTIFEGFNQLRPNQRLFNLTRSGYAGSQRYGSIPWSGDVGKSFGGLAVQLPMMLNMGMSGFAYHNSDIGGFTNGFTTPELYVRWMQYGSFCPIARAHGAGPGVGGQDTEPWAFGAEAERISKKYIELRYRLLPYIYTMAYKNYSTGLPLAHPLFFDYPTDPYLKNESSAYMWGDAMIAAPVVAAGQTVKTFYLPEGKWLNFWTDEILDGAQYVGVNAPLETLPLFVKAGSIIPMQPVMNYVDERPLDTLMLAVYPATGVEARFILYEDDGKTLAYQSGSFAQTTFVQFTTVSGTNANLSILINPTLGTYTGKSPRRSYISEIHSVHSAPTRVQKNGQAVAQRFSYDDLRRNGDGFFFDATTHRLYIHTPTVPDSAYQLVAENVRLTSVGEKPSAEASEFRLEQNYPNPFNPSTHFAFRIADFGFASLKIFDVLGREVAIVFEGNKKPGNYELSWDAKDIPSGVYFYRLRVDPSLRSGQGFVETKKLILVR